jgi:hypothetical protein
MRRGQDVSVRNFQIFETMQDPDPQRNIADRDESLKVTRSLAGTDHTVHRRQQ